MSEVQCPKCDLVGSVQIKNKNKHVISVTGFFEVDCPVVRQRLSLESGSTSNLDCEHFDNAAAAKVQELRRKFGL